MRYFCPPGRTSARTGTVRAIRSKSSRVRVTPARPAMAIRWITALVEPPRPRTVVTASSKASAVRMSDNTRSLWTSSTILSPAAAAIRSCPESTAGMLDAPGTVTPSASAAAVSVDAVPIVMQCPGDRASPLSSSVISQSPMRPARLSSQYFHMSVPDPRTSSRQWPGSIGPAGTKTVGRSTEAAPMSSAGVVLSQPPISTAPSTGYDRSSSSVSIASRLR